MSKKLLTTTVLTTALTISSCIVAFAGQWQQDKTGHWWQNDDGSYPTNSWQWLDGNGDGVAECYYFGPNGYMLTNTTTPDGYQVNENGAWVENGAVKTQGTQTNTNTGAHHNAGYDPARPLAGKIDEWNLKMTGSYTDPIISSYNVTAMLTGQLDQYFAPPVGEYVDAVGNHIYTTQEDYNTARAEEQGLYHWFCTWLNGMDFENMSEMDRAKEIQKVLANTTYDNEYATGERYSRNDDYSVLINKKGVCAEYAMTARSLATALGLKSAVTGTGNHAVYYIWVDGKCYMGNNEFLNLDYPSSLPMYM